VVGARVLSKRSPSVIVALRNDVPRHERIIKKCFWEHLCIMFVRREQALKRKKLK
jgi:hypothetical protein